MSNFYDKFTLSFQLGILSSFDSRLSKLEKSILPVHRETVDLQRRQKSILQKLLRQVSPPPLLPILFTQLFLNCQPDIDKVLRSFDNVISYHNVASSEDQDIRDGFVYGCILVLRYHCLNNWCLAFSARPGADVDSYLRSLENVKDAIGFFERNNPNSPELSLLVSVNKNSSS